MTYTKEWQNYAKCFLTLIYTRLQSDHIEHLLQGVKHEDAQEVKQGDSPCCEGGPNQGIEREQSHILEVRDDSSQRDHEAAKNKFICCTITPNTGTPFGVGTLTCQWMVGVRRASIQHRGGGWDTIRATPYAQSFLGADKQTNTYF